MARCPVKVPAYHGVHALVARRARVSAVRLRMTGASLEKAARVDRRRRRHVSGRLKLLNCRGTLLAER